MVELKPHAAQHAGTHVTLPYCWDLRSAGRYILNAHRFSFHLHGFWMARTGLSINDVLLLTSGGGSLNNKRRR